MVDTLLWWNVSWNEQINNLTYPVVFAILGSITYPAPDLDVQLLRFNFTFYNIPNRNTVLLRSKIVSKYFFGIFQKCYTGK
jgi:hypothetical protein